MKKAHYYLLLVELLGLVFLFVGFNLYVFFDNQTNHTGLPLQKIELVLILGLLVGVVRAVIFQKDNVLELFLISFFLYGLLFLSIEGYEYFYIMMEYDLWVKIGMPDRRFW